MIASIRSLTLRKKGSVAVECAIVLPILVFLISGLLFFARVFWCYTVAQKAAHDAARFLTTATLREIKPSATGSEVPISLVAQQIATDEISDLNSGGGKSVDVLCYSGEPSSYWARCYGYDIPKKILVRVNVPVIDPFFDPFTSVFTDGNPILLQPVMTSDYTAN